MAPPQGSRMGSLNSAAAQQHSRACGGWNRAPKAVQLGDGAQRILAVDEVDEGKAARLACPG